MWHVCPSIMSEDPQAKIPSSWHQHARHAPAVLAPDLLLANTMADGMHGGEHAGGRGLGLAIRTMLQLGVMNVARGRRDQAHVAFADSAVSLPVIYLLAPFDGDCADRCGDRESDCGGGWRGRTAHQLFGGRRSRGPLGLSQPYAPPHGGRHAARSGGVMRARPG